MPAHNAQHWIASAIRSVLHQTYTDYDLWVLENGSTDRTLQIAQQFTDERIKVLKLGPVGFRGALSYGLANAKSKWLARMDADDIMFPRRLEVQMRFLRGAPEYIMVGTNFCFLTPFGHVFERPGREWATSRELVRSSFDLLDGDPRSRFCADPSMIFERQRALAVGGYDDDFELGDVTLWIRMLGFAKGYEIESVLHAYRLQPDSISQCNRDGPNIRIKYGLQVSRFYVQQVATAPSPRSRSVSYWRRIMRYELATGDGKSVRRIAEILGRAGLGNFARRCRWFSYTGRLGAALYARRSGRRHRPDWERELEPFLSDGFAASASFSGPQSHES
jgi:glycosyltransferase involved in cell wall biosynthesis